MALFAQLGNYKNFGLLVMRAGLGVMMILHGLPKLTAGPAQWERTGHAMARLHISLWPAFWGFMSAVTMTVGGLFCILGLWFRLVCMLMVINFAVAAASHFADGETVLDASHALELAFTFLGLMFLGAGTISVDKS